MESRNATPVMEQANAASATEPDGFNNQSLIDLKIRVWLIGLIDLEKYMSSMIRGNKKSNTSNIHSSPDRSELLYKIIRYSNQALIISKKGEIIPATKENIRDLGKKVVSNDRKTGRIRAVGLSRAEVGRIIGDIVYDSTICAYSRKIPPESSNKPSPNRFEILLSER